MRFLKLVGFVLICEFAGVIGSVFTASSVTTWYTVLVKPSLNPPSWVFGPVWTTLFFLMGVSLFIVSEKKWKVSKRIFQSRKKAWNPVSERLWSGDLQKMNAVSVFLVQYILNIFWSYAFFGLESPVLGFFVIVALWISIVYVVVNFYRISRAASSLLIPYLLWVTFAAYLNYSIWMLN
ncbi:MAG: TspO protein [Candidatus Harrisonbacteria bacterium CG10_big_fil_rev_8_21_14_0_10_40_38]|uniref:TspO protein n=1 Tax=Candidatus Harrisonbacteria bacterium CG10_big_fil_rev_8_21_14_0_10_40_38 TaxID=1974583 RepID=A0A2H0URW9_9BACT|nr:MAG: TspO protein [Candidatus Harrisonbacteria bacterium CG10_big_fil_rev_8_21_14_0_10_40_38]